MSDVFRPMKACEAPTDLSTLRYPLYVSPKLDGVRATVHAGKVLSKTLKPIPNAHVQTLFGSRKFDCYDGELVVGPATAPSVCRATMSGVMARDGTPDVRLWVFDNWNTPRLPWLQRLECINEDANIGVIAMRHIVVSNEEELLSAEAAYIAAGYEGAMLRAPDGPYKYGRSTAREGWLMKLKRFADAEAVVAYVEEALENTNPAARREDGAVKRSSAKAGKVAKGMLGGFRVVGLNGPFKDVAFSVGPGVLTHVERAELWRVRETLTGRLITYKYFAHGSDKAPRHPTFKLFRDRRDV